MIKVATATILVALLGANIGLVSSIYFGTPRLHRPTPARWHADREGQDRFYRRQSANPEAVENPFSTEAEDQHKVATKANGEGAWYTQPDWWVAGGTIALVIATSGLWFFTALLWSTTKKAVTDGETAIRAAAVAASAATKQADIAEKSLTIVERGYLFVQRFEYGFWPIQRIAGSESPWIQPSGRILLMNRGRTPVTIIGHVIHVGLADRDRPAILPNYEGVGEGKGEIVLSAGETLTPGVVFYYAGEVTDEDVMQMSSGRVVVSVVCRFRYRDIFGTEHFRGTAAYFEHLTGASVTFGGTDMNYDRQASDKEKLSKV